MKFKTKTVFCNISKNVTADVHVSPALFVFVTTTGEQARDFNYPLLTVLDGYQWNNNDPTTLNYGRMSVLYCLYSTLFIRFNLLFLYRERWIRFWFTTCFPFEMFCFASKMSAYIISWSEQSIFNTLNIEQHK